MVQNKRWIFKKSPDSKPKAGETFAVEASEFDVDQKPPEGGLVVKVLWASLDPYLRGRMRPADVKSYFPPLAIDSAIANSVVAKVLKSDSSKAKEGDIVVTGAEIAEYSLVHKAQVDGYAFYVIPKDRSEKLKLSYYVGVLGMPGRTAWASFYAIGEPKKGETIWISAAAGPVGSIVGQLAKHEGLKTIGSVGSDDKLEYITKTLGFDSGFNYKTEKPGEAITRLAPDGVDIYYDNVGGEHLSAALDAAKHHARIIECGQVSEYNTPMDKRYPIRNTSLIVGKRLKLQGFIISDPELGPKYFQEHIDKLSAWIADGSFTAREHVSEGIDSVSDAFIDMLDGRNEGKAVVRIGDE